MKNMETSEKNMENTLSKTYEKIMVARPQGGTTDWNHLQLNWEAEMAARASTLQHPGKKLIFFHELTEEKTISIYHI